MTRPPFRLRPASRKKKHSRSPKPRRTTLRFDSLEDRAVPANIGYYDMGFGEGNPSQETAILAAGHTPVSIFDLSPAELAGIAVLDVQNPYGNPSEFLGQLPAIEAAVSAGLVLVIHDREVNSAESLLPGGSGFNIIENFDDSANIDVLDNTTLVTNGPGGIVDDATLDFGSASSHGFAFAGSLPGSAALILSTGDPTHIVTFAYGFGGGTVIYSSIPLDFYRDQGFGPFSDVYAPNVLAYAATNALGGLAVSSSVPASGSVVFAHPTQYTLNVSSPLDPGTVDAADFQVNGFNATGVSYTPGSTAVTFTFAVDPVTAEGAQAMAVAAGAFNRQSDGLGVRAFDGAFRYDSLLLEVTSTTPAVASVVQLPFTALDLHFNEAYDPLSAKPTDFTVSQGTVTAVSVVDADTLRLTLDGVVAEGTLTVGMAAGAMTDVHGNPAGAFSASYTLDFGTVPFPTPLKAGPPAGSLIYDETKTGIIDPDGDSDSFAILVDPGQKITVTVDPATGLRPLVELYRVDAAGNAIIGSAVAAAAGQEAVIQTVAGHGQIGVMGPGPKTYLVTVRGAAGTTGAYAVRIILNSAVEGESHDGAANNSRGTAQDLGPAFLSFNTSVGSSGSHPGQAAVLGRMEAATLNVIDSDNLESGALDGQWTTFSSQPQGRIQVSGAFGTAEGSFAVLMDRNPAGVNNLNEAIWTVDLTGQTQALLQFAHADFADEETALPLTYTGHVNGDGVSISADGVNWRRVLNATNLAPGWQTVTIDLAAEAAAAGMALGAGFQIKFQQFDNSPLTGGDGRGYDRIVVGIPVAGEDYHSFSLRAGDTVTLAMKGGAGLEMQNAAGATLATAVGGPKNFDKGISDFVAPATGTYYARLSNTAFTAADYALVVSRNSSFDTEGNDSLATAQAIAGPSVAGRQWAHGAITPGGFEASAVPFAFEDISGTGTPVLEGTDDDLWALSAADLNGFEFEFYGQNYTSLSFSTNGLITLGGFNASFSNSNLTTSPSGASIAVLWDDLETFSNAGAVYWQVLGAGADQRLVVQWHDVGYFAFNPGTITFQAILSEADGSIQFNYSDLDGGAGQNEGASATVGIKAPGAQGPDRLLLAFNDGPNTFVGSGQSTRISHGAQSDFYRVVANGNSMLQVDTQTPARSSGAFVNDFDPMVRIYNAAGVLVAGDDNSAPDGRNVRASYKVPRGGGGVFYIEVVASPATAEATTGEYILAVKGASAPPSGSPLAAAAVRAGKPAPGRLSVAAAQPLLREAVRAWQLAGFDTSVLGRINIRVADLGGDTLGLVSGNTIWLDTNAAGWGWFVDRTPRGDSEFRAGALSAARSRIDLLTVLIHEVGHLLGQVHELDGAMIDTLATGVRRRPGRSIA